MSRPCNRILAAWSVGEKGYGEGRFFFRPETDQGSPDRTAAASSWCKSAWPCNAGSRPVNNLLEPLCHQYAQNRQQDLSQSIDSTSTTCLLSLCCRTKIHKCYWINFRRPLNIIGPCLISQRELLTANQQTILFARQMITNRLLPNG